MKIQMIENKVACKESFKEISDNMTKKTACFPLPMYSKHDCFKISIFLYNSHLPSA